MSLPFTLKNMLAGRQQDIRAERDRKLEATSETALSGETAGSFVLRAVARECVVCLKGTRQNHKLGIIGQNSLRRNKGFRAHFTVELRRARTL